MIRQIIFIGCIQCGVPLAEAMQACMFCGHVGTITEIEGVEELEEE